MSNQEDLERQFRRLEQEVLRDGLPDQDQVKTVVSWRELLRWIDRQAELTKLVVIGLAGILGFMVLSLVLKLVSLAVSLAMVVVVLFVLYKLFWQKP